MEDFKVELKTKPGLMPHPEGRGVARRKGAGEGEGEVSHSPQRAAVVKDMTTRPARLINLSYKYFLARVLCLSRVLAELLRRMWILQRPWTQWLLPDGSTEQTSSIQGEPLIYSRPALDTIGLG